MKSPFICTLSIPLAPQTPSSLLLPPLKRVFYLYDPLLLGMLEEDMEE